MRAQICPYILPLTPRKTETARLKVSEEENRLLQKQLQKQRQGGATSFNNDKSSNMDPASIEKMKTALKSLKRVTVKQEMILQTMRESASDRRQQVQEKDVMIARLKHQLRSMDKSMKATVKC